MTTRTVPPTRRSTSATVVSQPCSPWNQRRSTSSLVQASKTASAGARKVRSISSVSPLIAPHPRGRGSGAPARRARPAGWRRCWPALAAPPPAARRRRERAASGAARTALRGGRVGQRVLEVGRLVVFVVAVPPGGSLGFRGNLPRGLPDLLAPERGDVEVAPGAAHRFVAALVDEVGAEDLSVHAQEGVGAVPLGDIEVGIEVVGDRVPGNRVPAHARLDPLDIRLRAT